jgi:hypothetical protein
LNFADPQQMPDTVMAELAALDHSAHRLARDTKLSRDCLNVVQLLFRRRIPGLVDFCLELVEP